MFALSLTSNATDVPLARNFFEHKFSGSRNDFTGHVGYEFTAEASFAVIALGRSVSGEALRASHTVTLWSTADKRKLASVIVTPKSKTDGFGYVDAMRDVFTAGGLHTDEVPTEQQKCRFTVLYPKE